MEVDNIQVKEGIIDNDLVSFFDLLASFDFEDKQKEKSEINKDLIVSAPMGSLLDSDVNKSCYDAETITEK